ncbi:hypothetical protein Pla144_09590 [Bythopirellula polymerisocia]|uniref:Uncharacterized protein n=1 Tax=Bythopirellula polymerisocia TaxID=2528003 RepID=A0A5C6CZ15_9BACT|nr:hypothetical protein Pla144_09590 [Bythopirellula polymerisocia]
MDSPPSIAQLSQDFSLLRESFTPQRRLSRESLDWFAISEILIQNENSRAVMLRQPGLRLGITKCGICLLGLSGSY